MTAALWAAGFLCLICLAAACDLLTRERCELCGERISHRLGHAGHLYLEHGDTGD